MSCCPVLLGRQWKLYHKITVAWSSKAFTTSNGTLLPFKASWSQGKGSSGGTFVNAWETHLCTFTNDSFPSPNRALALCCRSSTKVYFHQCACPMFSGCSYFRNDMQCSLGQLSTTDQQCSNKGCLGPMFWQADLSLSRPWRREGIPCLNTISHLSLHIPVNMCVVLIKYHSKLDELVQLHLAMLWRWMNVPR